ncbi:MAG: hypothetical protein O2854_02440 [Chloroflexi bacterium]|nr:hypothetical protein [Chloroflexota bacterium]
MKLLLTKLMPLSGVLLLMYATALGVVHAQTPTPITIIVDEDIGVDDDGSVPQPVIINVQETIGVNDGVQAVPGPPPVLITVNETVTVGDGVQVIPEPPPALITVNETVTVSDESDVQPQDVGPTFLDSVGFFANLLVSNEQFPTFTTMYGDEEVVVRLRLDPTTRLLIGVDEVDQVEVEPGQRVMIQTAGPARIGVDVADSEATFAVEILIIPDEATRTHRRGVVTTDDEEEQPSEGEHTVIDEEGRKRQVQGELEEGEEVILIIREKMDGTQETKGALQEKNVQERLARYEEKLAQAAAENQSDLT